ncbi:glycoside hydrolase family 13 protein [Sphaerisporangium perillae]|uniref:glycoside hydrolase family 13 protein n=1 Tax=Sphaerisporangium perillae TaxID=2935860 RepID=UPI00200E3DCD|nr:glycoside hydrolase family 13 protein [Sphaerisporangium perillae]
MTDVVREARPVQAGTRWWRDAVIYQVYVRSFADGNGDGVGDLLGVRSRLDYLAELGVDAIWLTPFYTSPMADFGYDVADYRQVDPIFGTLADAKALIEDAHRYGMRVIIDVVPNHTSDRHAWFEAAVQAGPGSPERERYLFREGKGEVGELPPNDWESIFGGPAWTRLPDGEWYLHLFAAEQPDLNWEHPEVHAEFEAILRFWLDLGVDGFRIDVAHGMVKAPGLPDIGSAGQVEMLGTAVLPYFDQDGVHEIHRTWRRVLDSYDGERIGVAEAWAPSQERLARYVRPDELHQAFNFHFLKTPWDGEMLRAVIDESLATVGPVGAPTTWVLSNHDVKRHVTRYGHGDLGLRRARAAALMMFALPGSTYVYQGEELGLPEVLDLPDEVCQDPQRLRDPDDGRDGCRVPIPWAHSEPPFGFSPPGIEETWLPVPEEWGPLSVESQLGDPGSTLSLYRAALRLRREHPALGDGTLTWRESPSGTLVFTRDEAFACTVNTTGEPVELPRPGNLLLASAPVAVEGETVRLAPDSAAWWALGDA